jgi:FdhD protein
VDGAEERQEYNVLRIHLSTAQLPDLQPLDRHFFTNSACGVCGRAMLDELDQRALPPVQDGPYVTPDLLAALPAALRRQQTLFATTGGLHAAALFDAGGNLLALREDVGRHNALDKLIGWGLLNGQLPFHDKIILVSGRASYELLQKCRVAAAPIFCAVSAPSSLAVELAERFGITLVGFLRDQRFNLYTRPERIVLHASSPPITIAEETAHPATSV